MVRPDGLIDMLRLHLLSYMSHIPFSFWLIHFQLIFCHLKLV